MPTIQTLHDKGDDYKVTPQMDGAVYGTAVKDCVCGGVGDEFTMEYSSTSLSVTFRAGSEAVIGGAFFRLTSDTVVDLSGSPNATVYLCANINTANPAGSTGSFIGRANNVLDQNNLNNGTASRDLLLYTITTGASGITAVADNRVIVAPSIPQRIYYGSSTPEATLGNDGDLYIMIGS